MHKIFYHLILLLLLYGCASEPQQLGNHYQPIFNDDTIQTIALKVQHIKIRNFHDDSDEPNRIERRMPVSATLLFNEWVFKKFKPIGHDGTLYIDILSQSITQHAVENNATNINILDIVRTDSLKYDAAWRIKISAIRPNKKAETHINANGYITVPNYISLFEQEQQLYNLSKDIMHIIDEEATRNVPLYFSDFLS